MALKFILEYRKYISEGLVVTSKAYCDWIVRGDKQTTRIFNIIEKL